MSQIRAIVVDDEPKSRQVLMELVGMFCPEVEVIAEAGYIDQAVQIIEEMRPDLVFFDILLQEGDSFEIIRRLDQVDFEMIFVTAFNESSVKALKFSGAKVLLKPIQIEDLKEAVSEIRRNSGDSYLTYKMADGMLSSQFSKIPVLTDQGLEFKSIHEVSYVIPEGSGSVIRFINAQQMVSTKRIAELQPFFDQGQFDSYNGLCIVNKQQVRQHDQKHKKLRMKDGVELSYS